MIRPEGSAPVGNWVSAVVEGGSISRSASLSPWHRLDKKWDEIQVGRQGAYSIERLESFEYYCKTTSRARVIMVCTLAPLPALTTAVLLECLPLRPPSDGWSGNWVFWIRLGLMTFTLTFAGISELRLFVPNLNITLLKRIVVSLGTSLGYVGTWLLATATGVVGFPVPFIWQFGGLLLGIYLPSMMLLVFGLAPFMSTSPCRVYLSRYLRLLFAYMALAGVYPLYKVLYEYVPVDYRGGALIILPLWKFGAKHFIMSAIRELEDFIPVVVSMTVDFFSALFVSVCISSSGSLYLSALFIAADVGQALLEFREVRANATAVIELLKREGSGHSEDRDLVAQVLEVTRDPRAFQVASLNGARLRACLPHVMTESQARRLDNLEEDGIFSTRDSHLERKISRSRRRSERRSLHVRRVQIASVVPIPVDATAGKGAVSRNAEGVKRKSKSSASGERSKAMVLQCLQLLFHCEYLALVEYVECVVPLVFATYNLILKDLPNVIYYPGGASHWGVTALRNILVFASLEVGSLFLLHYFLKRKFAFSPLYQLAFALETEMYLVQGSLFLEIVVLLQYELVHFGADFTFQFEWLRQ